MVEVKKEGYRYSLEGLCQTCIRVYRQFLKSVSRDIFPLEHYWSRKEEILSGKCCCLVLEFQVFLPDFASFAPIPSFMPNGNNFKFQRQRNHTTR